MKLFGKIIGFNKIENTLTIQLEKPLDHNIILSEPLKKVILSLSEKL